MPITLSDNTITVTLRDDTQWVDEFGWQPVLQAASYTVAGALVVEEAQMQAGRPITLAGADDRAWVRYADVQQLQAWASTPGQVLTLTLRGAPRQVRFDLRAGSPIAAQPVAYFDTPAPDDWFAVSALKFFEV